jgi:flagellar biosynthesis regulator FlaF
MNKKVTAEINKAISVLEAAKITDKYRNERIDAALNLAHMYIANAIELLNPTKPISLI